MDACMTEEKLRRMQQLIGELREAARAYYQEGREIMSNFAYDALYDELAALERETGVVLSHSPTEEVGYEVASDLPKERHPARMLSLDKTKDRQALVAWLGEQTGVLSWKLDGLTIVLTYENGRLQKAVTRGNGEVGEVVTANARAFENLPLSIAYRGPLVLRGEAVIGYADFERLNESLSGEAGAYKNPRNLCAGSVRQLDSRVTAERHVQFYAFALVEAGDLTFKKRSEQLDWLASQGFQVVERQLVTVETVEAAVEAFAARIEENPIPSDGLVLLYDDIAYGSSLGQTAKFPRDAIAFKWQDEVAKTHLTAVEWSASRTGLLNPVAVFEPVELEGTTVSRASVHNLSVVKELGLGLGDEILVYKANMIIPQIAEDLTRTGTVDAPPFCPVCGSGTVIRNENGVETVCCPNPACLAKQLKHLALFTSRDAMDMGGLSEATLEKFIARGFLHTPADLFRLAQHRQAIVEMEGFGEKSYANLQAAIEKARRVPVARFLYALGIPGIGVANARLIAAHCRNSWSAVRSLTYEELLEIDGVGDVLARGFCDWFADPAHGEMLADLLQEVSLDESYEESGSALAGLTFVITGTLRTYENREALKRAIEAAGGKVAGSVSARTSYLINNDVTSTSGKNKKAHELGVPIVDEETVNAWLAGGGPDAAPVPADARA